MEPSIHCKSQSKLAALQAGIDLAQSCAGDLPNTGWLAANVVISRLRHVSYWLCVVV